MQPYQKQVADEKKELDEKIERLKDFCCEPVFNGLSSEEKAIIERQALLMELYSKALDERIAEF
jgi:hypothetical protein